MVKFLKDNSLSLAFFSLFLACLAGQAITGYALQAEDPKGQSHASSQLAYLLDPSFLNGVFGNWQAAHLQLLALILLSVFLRQKGASHSRKPDDEQGSAERHRTPLHRFGRSRSWAYGNSLSLAFLALFLFSFTAFFFANTAVYNGNRVRNGEAPLDLKASLVSADFWFQTFQTWQAEFFAMGMFLLLSVFLRQEGSAESKPVEAGDRQTGSPNE